MFVESRGSTRTRVEAQRWFERSARNADQVVFVISDIQSENILPHWSIRLVPLPYKHRDYTFTFPLRRNVGDTATEKSTPQVIVPMLGKILEDWPVEGVNSRHNFGGMMM